MEFEISTMLQQTGKMAKMVEILEEDLPQRPG